MVNEVKMTVHGRWASNTYMKQKPLAIALSGVGRELRGRDDRGNVNNV
jgi:hypothetical protein